MFGAPAVVHLEFRTTLRVADQSVVVVFGWIQLVTKSKHVGLMMVQRFRTRPIGAIDETVVEWINHFVEVAQGADER